MKHEADETYLSRARVTPPGIAQSAELAKPSVRIEGRGRVRSNATTSDMSVGAAALASETSTPEVSKHLRETRIGANGSKRMMSKRAAAKRCLTIAETFSGTLRRPLPPESAFLIEWLVAELRAMAHS